MRIESRVTGLREIEQALHDLKRATVKNVLRRVGRQVLEPMADLAARLAPEDEGKLAFSIDVSEKGTRRAEWKRQQQPGTFVMAMGPASGLGTLQYAAFVEFGTIDTPAFPFMRQTWSAEKQDGLERAIDGLTIEVRAATDRARRSAARQAARR